MKRAVLANLQINGGLVRLSLDDVVKNGDAWQEDGLITHEDYSVEKFKQLDFSEKELADFGHYIMSRLLAAFEVSHK